jgi:hypothetical protein
MEIFQFSRLPKRLCGPAGSAVEGGLMKELESGQAAGTPLSSPNAVLEFDAQDASERRVDLAIDDFAFESAFRAGLFPERAGDAMHPDWRARWQGRVRDDRASGGRDQFKIADDGRASAGKPDQFRAKKIVTLHVLPPFVLDISARRRRL